MKRLTEGFEEASREAFDELLKRLPEALEEASRGFQILLRLPEAFEASIGF